MKRTWNEDELREQWSLLPEEQALLTHKTPRGQLGFVVLLKYFQLETRFPRDRQDIPPVVVDYLAQQLGTTPETMEAYDWHGHTGRLHRQPIREWLGFRTQTTDDVSRLVAWLRQDILPADSNETHMIDVPLTWYREQGIEPPVNAFLRRFIRSIRYKLEEATITHLDGAVRAVVFPAVWEMLALKAAVLHVRRVKHGMTAVHPLRGSELRALRQL